MNTSCGNKTPATALRDAGSALWAALQLQLKLVLWYQYPMATNNKLLLHPQPSHIHTAPVPRAAHGVPRAGMAWEQQGQGNRPGGLQAKVWVLLSSWPDLSLFFSFHQVIKQLLSTFTVWGMGWSCPGRKMRRISVNSCKEAGQICKRA